MPSARRVPFVKAHACGNDFLVMEQADVQGDHARLASSLCSRHTGLGADGIEFLERRADGSLFLRLFNSDGSEAELSGNGTRCVAAWLAASEGLRTVSFGTHGGVRRCEVVEERGRAWWIRSAMGVPRVMPRKLAIAGVEGAIEGAMVNVGNPHFVVWVDSDDFSAYGMSWQALGARIATDAMFPHGTNVEFVRVEAPERLSFRIFERGCGPTTSSGTGTSASSAAAIALRGAARELTATAEGGPQYVSWPDAGRELLLTGPAELICSGEAWF